MASHGGSRRCAYKCGQARMPAHTICVVCREREQELARASSSRVEVYKGNDIYKMPRVARLIHTCYSFVVSLIGWLANLEVCSFNEGEVPGGGGRGFT